MAGRGKRVLIGCGIGCGVLILLAVIVAIAFGNWVSGKGELLEPQRLLGADTTGYAEWTLRLEDPGTDGFVQLLIEALEAERAGQAQQMPSWLRRLLIEGKNEDAAQEIRELFPVVIAWTMAPSSEAGKDEMLLTLSPTGIGNRLVFADWIVGFATRWSDEGIRRTYRDEKIFTMPSESGHSQTVFLRKGTIFFTTDLDSAKVAVDRLQQQDLAERQAGLLDPLFFQTSADSSLRGAVSNGRGEIPRLWQEVAGSDGRELMEVLRSATLDGGLQNDGSLLAVLRFRGPDRDWAAARAEPLRELIERTVAETELELQVNSRVTNDVVTVELRIVDIIGTLQRWLDEQERRSGVRINL